MAQIITQAHWSELFWLLARFSQASDAQFSITVGAESRFLRVASDFYLKFTSPPLFYSLQWLKKISTGPSRT
ncbi:hypothetical protein GCM10022409_10730 [Hymenobacter glaciei]|uniref:Uncharacterized protein n=1 Tax=Hymenobacter glaciei TaxID=877209 RepID=A0ABP7TN85_9BACT